MEIKETGGIEGWRDINGDGGTVFSPIGRVTIKETGVITKESGI